MNILFITFNRTNQIFYMSVTQIATAQGFLLIQEAKLGGGHCNNPHAVPVENCNIWRC